MYFCYYWTRNVHASEGEAYEGDGKTWITSILTPVVQEFKPLASSLIQSNHVKEGVSVSQNQIRARIYRDPADGSHVLIIVNATASDQQAVVTLAGDNWQATRVIGDSHAQSWSGSEFKTSLKPHEVLVYRLQQR